ncbi:hypothetical protein [Deinococcus radiopugnans]|uniref:hypothetical protein n=1 Tax=Deinococcus radiopugnans TaxID=57497 RepID=UPI0012E05136|nr:hypothetical protein [Deinococcus radiopugnans]
MSQYPTGLFIYFADLIYPFIANFAGYTAYVECYLDRKGSFFTLPELDNPVEPLVIIAMQGFGIYSIFKQELETASSALPFLAGIVVVAGINCAMKFYLGENITAENAEKRKLVALGVFNFVLALTVYNLSFQVGATNSYLGLIFAFGAAAAMFLYYSAREWLNKVE